MDLLVASENDIVREIAEKVLTRIFRGLLEWIRVEIEGVDAHANQSYEFERLTLWEDHFVKLHL